jgi:hypothetical protein
MHSGQAPRPLRGRGRACSPDLSSSQGSGRSGQKLRKKQAEQARLLARLLADQAPSFSTRKNRRDVFPLTLQLMRADLL